MAAWKVSTGMRTMLKPLVSWFAAILGCLVGLGACAAFGMAWAPLSDRSPAWYLRLFGIAGMALLGVGFLLGSFVALRNRRSAGFIFLSVMPVAAFCLAYPASGFLVWRDGGGWFETPVPAIAIGLTALFYAPFLAPLWMWRRKKRAAIVFTSAALVAGLFFAYSRWTVALLPRLVGWSAPFLLWGLFWLRTGKLGWPSLVQPRPCSHAKRVLAARDGMCGHSLPGCCVHVDGLESLQRRLQRQTALSSPFVSNTCGVYSESPLCRPLDRSDDGPFKHLPR